MKKNLLIMLAMLLSVVTYAQFNFSGTVLTTTGAPVVGQTVFVATDSGAGWSAGAHGAFFNLSAITNATGAYSVTLPSTTLSGHPIIARTANCSGPMLSNGHTYAGVNITSNFTKCVPPPPPSVSGTVTLGTTTTGASNAKVYLIRKKPDSVLIGTSWFFTWKLLAIDSALTTGTGTYSMTLPSPRYDSLLVKAFLLPAHTSYSSYLPTYYTSSLMWSGATGIAPTVTTSVTANIALIGGTNPGGPGFVGGSVLLGANKSTAVGDPVPNRLIILTDGANKAIAYTYSNANGQFSFANVPLGSYKIFGDVGGKTSTPLSFSLTTANPTASFITFEEKTLTFNASMPPTGIAAVVGQSAGIHPNPAKNVLTITGLTGDADVIVYDVTGKIVVKQTVSVNNNTVNVATLATGNYILKLATAQDVTTLKFTKE